MTDKKYQNIKMKLPNNDHMKLAFAILQRWRTLRQTPRHFSKAILLYNELEQGHFENFISLLQDFFPAVAIGMQLSGRFQVESSYKQTAVQPKKITIGESPVKSAEEMLESSPDEFGIGDMFSD